VRERGNEKLKRMEFVSRASSQTKDNMYNERRIKVVVQRQRECIDNEQSDLPNNGNSHQQAAANTREEESNGELYSSDL